MANDTFLINWVLDGENDIDAITEYLNHIKEKYQYTSSFFISDSSKNYYYYDGILKQISPENDHDSWYYEFVDLNTPFDLDVDSDEARQGFLTVFINHRLETADGTFLGVTGVGLELSDIGLNLQEHQDQYDHKIYMVDADGLIQLHPNEFLILKENIKNIEGISDISSSLLSKSNEITITEYSDSLGKKSISSRYLPEFDWFLIVEKDQDASLFEARKLLWQNIFTGLGITIIILVILYIIVRYYNQRLEHLASIDSLTELFNRRFFLDMIKRELSAARRYGHDLSLIMLDIDNFKSINDKYGHGTGDKLLKSISDTIKNSLRESDITARWGGEEFIALLINADKDEAIATADRVRKAVEGITIDHGEEKIYRTISIGVSTLDERELDWSAFIQQADDALIQAKLSGKNQVAFYEGEPNK